VGRELGVTEEQLQALPRYRDSDAFDDDERLVIDLAVEMAKTPVELPAELESRLSRRFTRTELTELVAAIAWEGYRARFNRALGIEAVGFAEGAACALPERPDATRRLEGAGPPEAPPAS
jgi:alkylhydroperoxidase family enzyme